MVIGFVVVLKKIGTFPITFDRSYRVYMLKQTSGTMELKYAIRYYKNAS